jgi:protocatechuate 3,4-dioxygenase beta subunit
MKRHHLMEILFFGLVAFFCLLHDALAADLLPKTPADYQGPFYPVTRQEDIDNDLVHVKGRAGTAKGDILNLSGKVVNTRGEPRAGVTVEIWQTDPQGRYKHPGDSTPGERDPNFQYWGATTTGPDGTFFFKTIIPGAYEPRPAHIHFKVIQENKVILTSQIYFRQPEGRNGVPSTASGIDLQTVDVKPASQGEYETFFRIVI